MFQSQDEIAPFVEDAYTGPTAAWAQRWGASRGATLMAARKKGAC